MSCLLRRMAFEGFARGIHISDEAGLCKEFWNDISHAECFNLDDIGRACLEQHEKGNGGPIAISTGDLLRIPYRIVWMEYMYEGGRSQGILLRDLYTDEKLIEVSSFMAMPGSRPVYAGTLWLRLDDEGGFVEKYKVTEPIMNGYELGGESNPSPETAAYHLMGHAFPALYAIKLLNCKNVESRPTETWEVEKKACKGTGLKKGAGMRFHTIYVRLNSKRPPVSFSQIIADGRKTGLHAVRGHFKRYTADAPLFGHLVGTFWWPPSMRGDEALGIIEKEYVVTSESNP